MRASAQRVWDQIRPPTPSPYTEEELSEMAAPMSATEVRQDQLEKTAERTKNQRSRQWWNHR